MTRKMEEHVRHRYIFNLNFFLSVTGWIHRRKAHKCGGHTACAESVTQAQKEGQLNVSSSSSCPSVNPLWKPTLPRRNTKDKWITSYRWECRSPIMEHPPCCWLWLQFQFYSPLNQNNCEPKSKLLKNRRHYAYNLRTHAQKTQSRKIRLHSVSPGARFTKGTSRPCFSLWCDRNSLPPHPQLPLWIKNKR